MELTDVIPPSLPARFAARMAAATAALVLAATGCAGGDAHDDRGAHDDRAAPVAAGVAAVPAPAWVPARLRDRIVDRGPRAAGCGVFYDGHHRIQWDLYVSGGTPCRTALLVLADFDAHLAAADLTARCDYALCAPAVRSYRGYRCRLVHSFDDDYEIGCRRGARRIGFGYGA